VADIFQANQRAIGIAFEDDVIELSGFGKAADGANADLEFWPGMAGWAPTCPAATSTFCSPRAATTSSAVRERAGHADGIEPEAHGIFSFAEDEDVGPRRERASGCSRT